MDTLVQPALAASKLCVTLTVRRIASIADLLPWALKISYYFPAVADNQPGKIKTA